MKSELIVDVQPKDITLAVLEDEKLVELQKEVCSDSFSVGNIYLGRVKKIMPALNAAFIDIGDTKDGFIHYLDLGESFNFISNFQKTIKEKKKSINQIDPKIETLPKEGSISDVLKINQEILVQITKERISTKGPRLSAEISLAGRFMVLIPFLDKVSISQKIELREERSRLKELIKSIKPKNFGVIVRTNSENKKVAELDKELKSLVKKWDDAISKLIKSKKTPSLILEENSRAVALLRDIFNPSFEKIHINDKNVAEEIEQYVKTISQNSKNIVKEYKEDIPIFDHFDITKQIKSLFGTTVTLKNGIYLIIERTEALHVIDVNSGNRNKTVTTSENAYDVNLIAAEEIVRQLRLRDLGGIIVIDFIDMESNENKTNLYKKVEELMVKDRAKHNILPLSKFGLMQITRKRVRAEMEITTKENCPSCNGKKTINSSILFTEELKNKIEIIKNKLSIKKFLIQLHPYVSAYLDKGVFSIKYKWKKQYGVSFKIIPNQNLGLLDSLFLDKDGNEIDFEKI